MHLVGSRSEEECYVYVQSVGERGQRVDQHFALTRFHIFDLALGDARTARQLCLLQRLVVCSSVTFIATKRRAASCAAL